MGVERANLDDGPGGLGYALVELVGKFSFVAAAWRGLEERQWLLWTEEEDAVMMGHFSSKSGRGLRDSNDHASWYGCSLIYGQSAHFGMNGR